LLLEFVLVGFKTQFYSEKTKTKVDPQLT
jgi:hypothetical protein